MNSIFGTYAGRSFLNISNLEIDGQYNLSKQRNTYGIDIKADSSHQASEIKISNVKILNNNY
jgi:hypothetical protein